MTPELDDLTKGVLIDSLRSTRRPLPCPHCFARPANLDMHLRFDCPVLRPQRLDY